MSTVLDKYPVLSAAIRELLTIGVAAGKAARLTTQIAAATRDIPLQGMDLWERAIRAELWAAERAANEPSRKFWVRQRRFASWLDLCSEDGRKREAALRVAIGGAPSAFVLAIALRRFNDWVPQVRAAARDTLPEVALISEPEDVASALWSLLPHWNTWARMEAADREVLTAIASSERVALALKSKIIGATAGPAASVLAQFARSASFDSWLKEFAQGAVQPAVRARAFRWLFLGHVTWVVGHKWKWIDLAYCKGKLEPVLASRVIATKQPFLPTFEVAMADRSPLVRRIAAEFLIREIHRLGENALPLAQRTASDLSPAVAERGKFALKQLNQGGLGAPTSAA